MGFFNMFGGADINQGVREFESTPGAVLLDVRTVDEYSDGHIPGSINIPLDQLSAVGSRVPQLDTPLFVHCLSGGRSGRAVALLKQQGYTNVNNIGGINGYNGKIER